MTSSESVRPGDLLAVLDASGVSYRVHRHPPARNQSELALTGLDINTSAKTLAFQLPDARLVLAAIPGAARLRYPLLAAALSVPRSALRPAEAAALATLQMAPGGVAPFTASATAVLVLEPCLLELPKLYCGGGVPELSVEITPADLLAVMPNAIIAPLCDQD